jgi:hypothetical protein
MRQFAWICVFVLLVSHLNAQMSFNDSMSVARNKLTQKAMIVLGTWSVVNITSGFILANQSSGEMQYFWKMNAYWNFINLGLAALAYTNTMRVMNKHYGFEENLRQQYGMEKLYLFNAGLDLFYIAGGIALHEHGKTETDTKKLDQFKGYGKSIVFQGGFLLLMDIVMYSLHHSNTKRMLSRLQKFELTVGPGGLGLIYKF